MKGAIALRKPVATVALDMSGTNVTTAAWATVIAALGAACSSLEIFNPSGSPMQIAIGAAGVEVAIPYTVLPGGSAAVLPVEIAKGVRISAKAYDTNVTAGRLIINFFG